MAPYGHAKHGTTFLITYLEAVREIGIRSWHVAPNVIYKSVTTPGLPGTDDGCQHGLRSQNISIYSSRKLVNRSSLFAAASLGTRPQVTEWTSSMLRATTREDAQPVCASVADVFCSHEPMCKALGITVPDFVQQFMPIVGEGLDPVRVPNS